MLPFHDTAKGPPMDKELLKLLGKQHREKIKGIGADPDIGAEHAAPPSFEDRFGSDPVLAASTTPPICRFDDG